MTYDSDDQKGGFESRPPKEIIDIISRELVQPERVISILNEVVRGIPELDGLRVGACTIAQKADDQYSLLAAADSSTAPSSLREASSDGIDVDLRDIVPVEVDPTIEIPSIQVPPESSPSSKLIDAFNEALLVNEFPEFSVVDFKMSKIPTVQGQFLVLGCRITISNYNIYIDCD